jgi:hypothetical protein
MSDGSEDLTSRAAERMRENARWFIAGLAGVAITLFAGVRLASVGELVERGAWGRLLGTTLGYLLAAVSLAVAVSAVWGLARGGRISIEDLKEAEAGKGDLAKWLDENRYLLRSQPSVDELWKVAQKAQARAGRAFAAYWRGLPDRPEPRLLRQAQAFQARANRLSQWVNDLLVLASYERMSQRYGTARGWLAGSAVGVVVGVAILAAFSSVPTRTQVGGGVPVLVQLNEAGIQAHAKDLGGEDCAKGDLRGVAVDGPLSEPVVVLSRRPNCPSAHITVKKRDGVAIPQVTPPPPTTITSTTTTSVSGTTTIHRASTTTRLR